MRRYWYKTKRPNKISGVREMRVFRQLPHGYDIFLGEVIHKRIGDDGKEHYIHTLYDRKSDNIVAEFDDTGNCGFACSRDEIEKILNPMLISAGQQTRKKHKTKSKVKRNPKK